MFMAHMSEEAYREYQDEMSYIPETFCPDGWRESALYDARMEALNQEMEDQHFAELYWKENGTMNMVQLEFKFPKVYDPDDIMF